MKDPCVIMTGKQINQSQLLGTEILPEIFIVAYQTEFRAKEDAKEFDAQFARIDIKAVLGLR